MKPLPHHYRVCLRGSPQPYGTAESRGVPDLSCASPVDFDGPGDAWSPEQLLLASVASCFHLTFRAVAEGSHIEFSALLVNVEGILDRQDGSMAFTRIIISPTLVLEAGADVERARRALEKAERGCLITNSLDCDLVLETHIVAGQPLVESGFAG